MIRRVCGNRETDGQDDITCVLALDRDLRHTGYHSDGTGRYWIDHDGPQPAIPDMGAFWQVWCDDEPVTEQPLTIRQAWVLFLANLGQYPDAEVEIRVAPTDEDDVDEDIGIVTIDVEGIL